MMHLGVSSERSNSSPKWSFRLDRDRATLQDLGLSPIRVVKRGGDVAFLGIRVRIDGGNNDRVQIAFPNFGDLFSEGRDRDDDILAISDVGSETFETGGEENDFEVVGLPTRIHLSLADLELTVINARGNETLIVGMYDELRQTESSLLGFSYL